MTTTLSEDSLEDIQWLFLGPVCPQPCLGGPGVLTTQTCSILLWGLSWEDQGLRAQLSPLSVLPTHTHTQTGHHLFPQGKQRLAFPRAPWAMRKLAHSGRGEGAPEGLPGKPVLTTRSFWHPLGFCTPPGFGPVPQGPPPRVPVGGGAEVDSSSAEGHTRQFPAPSAQASAMIFHWRHLIAIRAARREFLAP